MIAAFCRLSGLIWDHFKESISFIPHSESHKMLKLLEYGSTGNYSSFVGSAEAC